MEKKTETRAKITTEMEASLDDSARKFSAGDVLIDKRHSQQESAANLPQFNVKHLRKTRGIGKPCQNTHTQMCFRLLTTGSGCCSCIISLITRTAFRHPCEANCELFV